MRAMYVTKLSAMKVKKCIRKGCTLYAIHVLETKEEHKPDLENFAVLREFRDVFPDEVLRLPPKKEIDLSIKLKPKSIPISKEPYRMSTPKLMELKMHIQVLLEKKYIRPSVSPWGALVLFVNKKDGTL